MSSSHKTMNLHRSCHKPGKEECTLQIHLLVTPHLHTVFVLKSAPVNSFGKCQRVLTHTVNLYNNMIEPGKLLDPCGQWRACAQGFHLATTNIQCLAEVDKTFMKVMPSTFLRLLLPLFALHSLNSECLLVSVVSMKDLCIYIVTHFLSNIAQSIV